MSAPVVAAVVSWNTRDLLAHCLTALHADAEAGLVEVHVVDNASTDGSAELVRDEFAWATLHEPRENLGYGRAVNLVADATRSPWILAANADTAPEPGAIRALLDAAAVDTRAGAVSPRLVLPDGTTQHSAFPLPTLPFLAAFNAGLLGPLGDRACLEGRWDPLRPRRVPWAVAAFLLVRRAAWHAAGGFDPRQWMYAEDLDLGWRLRRAGWHTRHVPGAVVHHESGASTAQAWDEERRLRWQAETYAWLRRRHGPAYARAAYLLNRLGAEARARLAREGWQADRAREWARIHRDAWRR